MNPLPDVTPVCLLWVSLNVTPTGLEERTLPSAVFRAAWGQSWCSWTCISFFGHRWTDINSCSCSSGSVQRKATLKIESMGTNGLPDRLFWGGGWRIQVWNTVIKEDEKDVEFGEVWGCDFLKKMFSWPSPWICATLKDQTYRVSILDTTQCLKFYMFPTKRKVLCILGTQFQVFRVKLWPLKWCWGCRHPR